MLFCWGRLPKWPNDIQMTIIPIPRVSHPWHIPLAVDLAYARLAWGTTCRSLVISSWAVLLRTSRQSGLSSRHAWHETRASWLYLDRTFQLCSSTSEVDMQGWFNCRIQSWHREHKTYTEWSIARGYNIATVSSLKATACLMRSASYTLPILAQSEVEGTTKVCADLALTERPGEYLWHYVSVKCNDL